MKPTPEQYRAALQAAAAMRDSGDDPAHLAKTLLYLDRHAAGLEKLFLVVERYIRFGQDEGEHRRLVRLIEELRQAEAGENRSEAEAFGLTSSR